MHGLSMSEAVGKEKGGLDMDAFLNLLTYEQDNHYSFSVMWVSKSQRVSNWLGLECVLYDQHCSAIFQS